MNGIRGQFDSPRHAFQHGVMAQGNDAADYYLSQSDPGHWIAVGLADSVGAGRLGLRRMLVGQGRTEDEAIHALWVRIAELSGEANSPFSPERSAHR